MEGYGWRRKREVDEEDAYEIVNDVGEIRIRREENEEEEYRMKSKG